ncbi:hypothetical protein ABPG75_006056 [Micractinium tetrahymenae]
MSWSFYEYLPLREPPAPASLDDQLRGMYPAFTFGKLATLVTTDQRFSYRTEPALSAHDPDRVAQEVPNLGELRAAYHANLSSPTNVMIGDEQLRRLAGDFNASVASHVVWQLYANQVIIGERRTPDVQQAIRDMYAGLAESALLHLLNLAAGQLASAFSSARVLVSAGARHYAL